MGETYKYVLPSSPSEIIRYSTNGELITKINTLTEWQVAAAEFKKIMVDLESALNVEDDFIFLSLGGSVIKSRPVSQRYAERNANSSAPIMSIFGKDWTNFAETYQRVAKDGKVLFPEIAFMTVDAGIGHLRLYFEVGYDTVVRDLFANRKIEERAPGIGIDALVK